MASLGESVFPHYRQARPSVDTIETSRRAGGRIIAVGTTSVRVLETAGASGMLEPLSSNLFHRPNNVRDHRAGTIDLQAEKSTRKSGFACITLLSGDIATELGFELRKRLSAHFLMVTIIAMIDRESSRVHMTTQPILNVMWRSTSRPEFDRSRKVSILRFSRANSAEFGDATYENWSLSPRKKST